ncbi:MAG: heparinase II/III family protein [Verrucomicrobia bacterium]|nr:heparinase II/III family protein [Verrucomicrobiota bacterium]
MRSKLHWYWRRLRAMRPVEVGRHGLKKLRQLADSRRLPDWPGLSLDPADPPTFPTLPSLAVLPAVLRQALQGDAAAILAGRWRAFGHLELRVDNPPEWHTDYLAGIDLRSDASAFRLEHRQQPGGADIKLIWEPNRWFQLVRLAQAAWALGDARAADTCRAWLTDWARRNPPYRGLNWTSALETGLRLVQFAWMDALLAAANRLSADWAGVRREILPAHTWYTWRHRSFGSSANNHLLGELAGLLLAVARWPTLARLAAPLERLQATWEREVLRQFAPDGGNREQALGYHLFSWEFCWQTQAALHAAHRTVSTEVTERLSRAGEFYARLKLDEWDYGDSDNAFVTPFFADETQAAQEWRAWFRQPESSPAIQFWWGTPARQDPRGAVDRPGGSGRASTQAPPPTSQSRLTSAATRWRIFPDAGYAVFATDDWRLRWDLSPLGYLATAAHGHLDALHLSLVYRDVSFLVDPGTGAYYADPAVRAYLASWRAHNGPHPVGANFPERLGTFLWGKPHARPTWRPEGASALRGELALPQGVLRRVVKELDRHQGWEVADGFAARPAAKPTAFNVHWQFAPGTQVEQVGERQFRAARNGVQLNVGCTGSWSEIRLIVPPGRAADRPAHRVEEPGSASLEMICSSAFRRLETGPALWLTGRGDLAAGCGTRFVAGSAPEET